MIVFGKKLEHLDLIEYVIVDLLKVKWNSFVKRTFYTQFAIFVAFFILSSCCFIMRETTPTEADSEGCSNMTDTIMTNITENITNIVSRIKREDYLQVCKLYEMTQKMNSMMKCKYICRI